VEPAIVTLEDMERHHILKVLEQTGWRISGERGAAKMLNINASTLRSRMEKLGIKKWSLSDKKALAFRKFSLFIWARKIPLENITDSRARFDVNGKLLMSDHGD